MLKWFWTYFPGFTRSISRLVHPNKSTSGHGPMNRLWAEAKETFKQMNSLLMWIGGVQVPNCLTSKKVLKDLKSVKRTRTVLTCCTKNASAIETSKLGRESHIFQIMHSHKVMAKIARWYNEVAPLNCLIRSPFHHSADIPFFFCAATASTVPQRVRHIRDKFQQMEKWCQKMPLDFTDFTPGSIIVHDIEGDFIFHHLNVLVDDSSQSRTTATICGDISCGQKLGYIYNDYC